MIKKVLLLSLLSSHSILAMQMSDFIQKHYNAEGNEVEVKKNLVPSIIVGDHLVFMEAQKLKGISQIIKAPIEKGSQYKWTCASTKEGISYAFISDNEMGNGDLTSIALLKNGEGCKAFTGEVSVTIKGVPLLSATSDKLSKTFGSVSESYYKDTPVSDKYTQSNTIQYFLTDQGVIISQITEN